ncbi:hypothetical protein B4100_3622 [Heyndrickxia coagulans]|nr:hypothetical protein B4100_3622 [Heyndrickxia coagulans]
MTVGPSLSGLEEWAAAGNMLFERKKGRAGERAKDVSHF